MSDNRYMFSAAMKGQAWELAKGHLRALVQLQGSYQSGSRDDETYLRFESLQNRVETFIEAIEGDGLHE